MPISVFLGLKTRKSKYLTVSVKAYKLHPEEYVNNEESTYNSDVNTLKVRQEAETQYTPYYIKQ